MLDKLKRALFSLIMLSILVFGIKTFFPNSNNVETNNIQSNQKSVNSRMTYGRFLEYLEMGWVKKVDLYDNSRNAVVEMISPESEDRWQTIRVEIPVGASQLIQKLKDYKVDFDAHPTENKTLSSNLVNNITLPLIFVALVLYYFKGSESINEASNSSSMPVIESLAKFERRPDTGVFFDDIAGIDEAKEEFEEVVSFLKEPEKYTIVGARIPKGVLLVGPPGTGKTLLAKAIANEADVPFFSVAGSEFVEMFIGIGAARVRDLFENAAENAPCIIFIDEIDAVGRERGAGIGGGNDEREQTLNQLLTEMDGFKENKGVIVVGATNRIDILDAALLRPGRFDRQIAVKLPDRLGRLGILKVHARNKPIGDDVDLGQLANKTPGFSGADLANILNEAAILTTRYGKSIITQNEIVEAIDRIIGGIPGTPMKDGKIKRLIAYHEIGHAIAGSVLRAHQEVEKITVVPRGEARGLTWFVNDEDADSNLITRTQLLARIITALAGRAAEQVVFGAQEITTGAENDIQQATSLARQMVTRFGMSCIGPIALEEEDNNQVFLGDTMIVEGNDYTDSTANRIDTEICYIINYCEQKALEIILDNRVVIDLAVERLVNIETLEGEEFRELIRSYTILPNKKIPYVSKLVKQIP